MGRRGLGGGRESRGGGIRFEIFDDGIYLLDRVHVILSTQVDTNKKDMIEY